MDVLKGFYSIMEDAIPQGCGYPPRNLVCKKV
ncbi:Uncharacterised protein [Legionella wadsworthii]|uniref:Uncharacterized protein n=1 Tax=Legionella wadsworthii TaxID=28088 RepID=A0A378LUX2_9GAMM|nr:Uncharacterised protein [Legionella wadsworthii]